MSTKVHKQLNIFVEHATQKVYMTAVCMYLIATSEKKKICGIVENATNTKTTT